jgi:hypothetical protein
LEIYISVRKEGREGKTGRRGRRREKKEDLLHRLFRCTILQHTVYMSP